MKFSLGIKELVIYSLLGAILVLSQVGLSYIPNVEIVTLLIIICSLVFGIKCLFSVGLFVIIMGTIYGFGFWWVGYVIIWPTLCIVTLLAKKYLINRYLILALYSAIFGMCFGLLYSLPSIVTVGLNAAIAHWIAGISFDIIHGVSNYIVMICLGKRLYSVLINLKQMYL